MIRRLQMPAVGNISPGNRLTEPIGQNDEREPDDDRKFCLAIFYVMNVSVTDVRKKQREFMPVTAVAVLPLPPAIAVAHAAAALRHDKVEPRDGEQEQIAVVDQTPRTV